MFSLVFLNMQSNQEFMFMLFDKQIEYILGTNRYEVTQYFDHLQKLKRSMTWKLVHIKYETKIRGLLSKLVNYREKRILMYDPKSSF